MKLHAQAPHHKNARRPVREALGILSGCPAGARKGLISIFAMRLHSKKGRLQPSFFLSYFLKQRDRVRRDAKSLSGKAESLLGRRLDADAGSVK